MFNNLYPFISLLNMYRVEYHFNVTNKNNSQCNSFLVTLLTKTMLNFCINHLRVTTTYLFFPEKGFCSCSRPEARQMPPQY